MLLSACLMMAWHDDVANFQVQVTHNAIFRVTVTIEFQTWEGKCCTFWKWHWKYETKNCLNLGAANIFCNTAKPEKYSFYLLHSVDTQGSLPLYKCLAGMSWVVSPMFSLRLCFFAKYLWDNIFSLVIFLTFPISIPVHPLLLTFY